MILRAMKEEDLERLERIHNKYYKNEFPFPDFTSHFLNAFIVENEGLIVTAGGLRVITEAVAVTNKELNINERAEGLGKLLSALAYTAHRDGFNEIHAFVQEERWKQVLLNRQFKKTKGEALVFSV